MTDAIDTAHRRGLFGIGDLGDLKDSLMDYLELGGGAAGAILLTDLIQSKVLVRNGQPIIPVQYAPWATALMAIVGGEYLRRHVRRDLGSGAIAGGVGVAVSALVAKFASPAVAATSASASASEGAGTGPAATAGFGFGRAFAGSLGAFSGLGYARMPNRELLYGVGSDVGAARMFNGATVQFEEQGGAMAGATVQFEDQSAQVAGFIN